MWQHAATPQPTEHLVFLGHGARIALAPVDGSLAVSAVTDPPLTVLAQPVEETATAMTRLLERLGGRDEARKLVLPLEFRARESS